MRLCVLTALALLAGCARLDQATDPKPQDFALSLPVTAGAGAPVQRIDLPASALMALRRADRGDIRVYDAHDRPLSLALLDTATTREDQAHLDAFPRMLGPIMPGNRDAAAPLSVRVQQGEGVVSVDAGGSAQTQDAAVLIDTRSIKDPVVAIVLDASLPLNRPVTFSIAASTDLRTWEPLAERALFQSAKGAEPLGGGRIVFPALLQGRTLKISWPAAAETRVSGVTIFTVHTPPPARITVATTGLHLVSPHTAQFTLPPAASPLAMRVAMTGQDGVIPVHLSGRATAEMPWTPLAFVSLRQSATGAALEIGDPELRQFKLDADDRSAGFSQAPRLDLQFAPVSLIVAFNGAAPYRLLVGDAAARPALFQISDIAGDATTFPTATVAHGDGPAVIDLSATGQTSRFTPRIVVLWLALLSGVGVLAFAAWKLLQANSR